MSRSAAAILTLILTSTALAQAPPPERGTASQANMPWVVSVVHTIDLQRMVALMREQQMRVGVAGTAPRYIYNITTGLVMDDKGHVVTRLSNLDLQDKDHKLTVMSSDGTTSDATLIGVDFATGFAVLEVASLKGSLPRTAPMQNLANGSMVTFMSSDVVPRTVTDKVYLTPSIIVSQGRIFDSIYSRPRGALTLQSESFLSRKDGSLVVTAENQVVGMAQYAGAGRAYVYSFELIRDTFAKRVIENKGHVAAGWLGIKAQSVSQLEEPDIRALGLRKQAGVIVLTVAPESPAAQAGVLPSDVLMRLNEFEIDGETNLRAMLSIMPAGQPIKLGAIRNQQSVEFNVVLSARPVTEQQLLASFGQAVEPLVPERDQLEQRMQELIALLKSYQKKAPSRETAEAHRELEIELRQIHDAITALDLQKAAAQPRRPTRAPDQGYVPGDFGGEQEFTFKVGFTARTLSPQLAANLQARGGIWVSKVLKDSAADRSGLKAGDVVVGTQDRVLLNAAQLQVFLASQQGPVALKVVRNKQPIVVSLELQ